MIDRIRLTATAKNQLIALKRKTGIEHYNAICRHALCISLANPSQPPMEEFSFSGGLEIDWKTFTGANEELYLNLLLVRAQSDSLSPSSDTVKKLLAIHVHRGLSFLLSKGGGDVLIPLARDLI